MKRFYAYYSVVQTFSYAVDACTAEEALRIAAARIKAGDQDVEDDSVFLSSYLLDGITMPYPDGIGELYVD